MKRLRLWLMRPGVARALMLLGGVFVVFYPLGRNWAFYVAAIGASVLTSIWAGRRRRVEVLERYETETERVWIIRMTDRRIGGKFPREPSLPEPAMSAENPSETSQTRSDR
jgi:hypothetical protein